MTVSQKAKKNSIFICVRALFSDLILVGVEFLGTELRVDPLLQLEGVGVQTQLVLAGPAVPHYHLGRRRTVHLGALSVWAQNGDTQWFVRSLFQLLLSVCLRIRVRIECHN